MINTSFSRHKWQGENLPYLHWKYEYLLLLLLRQYVQGVKNKKSSVAGKLQILLMLSTITIWLFNKNFLTSLAADYVFLSSAERILIVLIVKIADV